ncbi:MAG: S8 family peptidase [Candidatus Zixiibacteriota bacterium]|nr:MAG: S8 family peptidase [candidate division Zixibacteria bacterium]
MMKRATGHKIKPAALLVSVFLIISTTGFAQDKIVSDKLTPSARLLVNSADRQTYQRYWLYLDSSAVDPDALQLSERSLARRARVDPVNFLIDWKDYPISDSVLQEVERAGMRIRRTSRWLKAVSVEADFSGVATAVAMSFVRKIDPVKTFVRIRDDDILNAKPIVPPRQTIDYEYGLTLFQNEFIKAVKLHKAGLTGSGVMIAVFDTGFDINHPAFAFADIFATYDFINNDVSVDDSECPSSLSTDQNFHGTAVLSVIAGNVSGTFVGVAPNATFLLAKTEISCDFTEIKQEEDNWIAAMEWADALGADIISSSVGYAVFQDEGSYTFEDLDGNTTLITIAADEAAANNILVVNSAGNERNKTWGHILAPAGGDSVLAVGAVNGDSTLASFSSPGPTADGRIKPDIVTLGVGVATASHLGGYLTASGTSFSAPLTAGGAALAMERDPTLTAMDLLDRIKETGSQASSPDNDFGWGLFDAAKAANLAVTYNLPGTLQARFNRPEVFQLEVVGWGGPIPALTAIYLPDWVSFTDNGDGTGVIGILADSESSPIDSIVIEADVIEFADTTSFKIEVFPGVPITAGPNPFRDEVTIFVGQDVGDVQSISIFNSAGEIVWEKVNNFAQNADATYGLQEIWDGRNQYGRVAAAGVYIVTVVTDRQTFRVKLLKTD